MHLATGTNLFAAHRKHSGAMALAFNVVRPQKVLMLEQEIGDFSLKERILSISNSLLGQHKELFLDNLFTHSCDRDLRLDTPAGCQSIEKLIEQVKPNVLMLDPLIEFHEQDENSAQAMARVMRNLDVLRDHFKCAIILAHHASKNGEKRGPDALRGSSALYGKGDSFFMLDVINRDAGIIQVEVVIRRDKPITPFKVKIDWASQVCLFHEWTKERKRKRKGGGDGNPYDEYIV
jgi:AAA domain